MNSAPDLPLAGRVVAVPETRELDTFARMLERQGAIPLRCPLVAIRDVDDPAPVEAWLRRFQAGGCDDLILLTGEGVRRLLDAARRAGLDAAFLASLRAVRKIVRGPKPVRALRDLGIEADIRAGTPTTEGVISVLSGLALTGRRIGVQLYPDHSHAALLGFIAGAGAVSDPVLPYAYASATEDGRVADLIVRLAAGTVDVIAFTSAAQVRRLVAVAQSAGKMAQLREGVSRTVVAAVGPVVAAELAKFGIVAGIVPRTGYLMKPLINAITEALARNAPD